MSRRKKKQNAPAQVMVVNDLPGEECRIAILEDGRLEELYSERTATATNVGNIYKGRVVNVEPAIQAAFIDFGTGQNGFLHISDLHPRYFPDGKDRTERVGRKIPRRDRPPIQAALKRGDSILVQVIKEGIGTKGPTLTSYLSIPGRLMVMMPDMDRVGVSRKIEDEEKRREMRKVLDSLDLPEGIGFILRTAGFGQTKTELRRDLAYLNRLWKQMDKRRRKVQTPAPLYTESDLLVRTIRDVLNPAIEAIVVDSESAFNRASEFLRVVAPRSAPQVIRYRRPAPIFHAFNVETQIDLIHKREVALPSGGQIVIDQTEALVAIDVNSGKSRSARDSESNAYHTNCEAVDEICRQLRLRDLGGLVINDLIDMGRIDNRKAIERRFRDNLARDRAKTTITRISDFGVLEMTRQRMRPSMRKSHYQSCPHCEGRGEIRSPESKAAEALRFVAYLLQFNRVHAVEVVCSSRVASSFLSGKRRELLRLEEAFGKAVRVRVSESFAADRVDYYAYDDRNADVDISKLPAPKPPSLKELAAEDRAKDQPKEKPAPKDAAVAPDAQPKKKRRRRRRKKSSGGSADGGEQAKTDSKTATQSDKDKKEKEQASADTSTSLVTANGAAPDGQPSKKKRRRRRRRSRKQAATQTVEASSSDSGAKDEGAKSTPAASSKVDSPSQSAQQKKSSRRRRRSRKKKVLVSGVDSGTARESEARSTATAEAGSSGSQDALATDRSSTTPRSEDERRSLYRSRRRLTAAEAKEALEKSER